MAVVLMLTGIGLIGVLTATVASYFVEGQADEERAKLTLRLDRIEAMLAQLLPKPDEQQDRPAAPSETQPNPPDN